ncbi:hypothetical protein [Acinetobacter baumannii]|uniref:hypothetical protein n=1 Tax=Acinetobacter baumannii TaxID=470 RepID=UPI0008DD8FC7|nr:hypothetical protein [Acinetobacter baumannii]OIB60550.1 hypothetical protein A7L04_05610 [Acinetobacter baumannii]OIB74482.1 hypothetical protein A7L08_13790 [Acinetobacter baumannii]OIF39644.1 hypothetical protein A7M41_16035 [Acinetobacter baumannii]
MDNYKIKVKDEAESKEAQELFFELGYSWLCCGKYYNRIGNYTFITAYPDEMLLRMGWGGDTDKELTLPQLRDLVVLKRNDVNDANWETEGGDQIFKDSNDKSYIYRSDGWDELQRHEMRQAMWEKPKAIAQPQDPALISGADALRALADGKDVDVHESTYKNEVWFNLKDTKFTPAEILAEKVRDKPYTLTFRLKPQTIKLELELPKPFEPEEDCHVYILDDGKTDGYRRYSYEVHGDKGNTFIGIWRTEEEIKQVVEQLRKIRGTNS